MMNKKQIFELLNMEETTDRDKITGAYRNLLKENHPEGFRKLREAFEAAIALIEHPEEEDAQIEAEKTEVDEWMEQVEEVYNNLLRRRDIEAWKTLFSDEVCTSLDTLLEAREKLLVFYMSHSFLPHRVWKLFNHEFQFLEDMEVLQEQFPTEFLTYIASCITEGIFLPYELFSYQREMNLIKNRN